jgi:NADPH2:quinone reductase
VRAVRVERPGPPQVLEVVEVPDPEPGPDEVLIDVAVAAIVFVDTQVRAGRSPRPQSFPLFPGNGVAGTVAAVGERVDPATVGRRVVSATGGSGGYAERVVVPATEPYDVPDALGLQTAAALLADGRTAIGLAQAAGLAEGDRVLVTAAGGGVGSLLVQLARRAGAATVVGLAGSERKLALARERGADVTADYRQPGWAGEVRAATPATDSSAGEGVDVVFDGVGGEVGAELVGLAAPGARYVIHGMASGSPTAIDPAVVDGRKLTVVTLGDVLPDPGDVRSATAEALAAAADGWLVPTIGQTFPLDRVADAHAAIESRVTLGKTLLLVGGPEKGDEP